LPIAPVISIAKLRHCWVVERMEEEEASTVQLQICDATQRNKQESEVNA